MMNSNWFYKSALVILFASGLLIIYISYLLLWPQNPISVIQPYKIQTPIVKAGTKLVYETRYCNHTNTTFSVDRKILNVTTNDLVDIPDRLVNIRDSCKTEEVEVVLPQETEPGKYKLLASVIIQVNPIREVTYHLETEVFTVISTTK